MKLIDLPRLEKLVAWIDEARAAGADAELIVDTLCLEHGATSRFTGGALHLRVAGVATSCTEGPVGLLRNWQAAARRRIGEAGR